MAIDRDGSGRHPSAGNNEEVFGSPFAACPTVLHCEASVSVSASTTGTLTILRLSAGGPHRSLLVQRRAAGDGGGAYCNGYESDWVHARACFTRSPPMLPMPFWVALRGETGLLSLPHPGRPRVSHGVADGESAQRLPPALGAPCCNLYMYITRPAESISDFAIVPRDAYQWIPWRHRRDAAQTTPCI